MTPGRREICYTGTRREPADGRCVDVHLNAGTVTVTFAGSGDAFGSGA